MQNANSINKQTVLLPWAHRGDDSRLQWQKSNSEYEEKKQGNNDIIH